MLLFWKNILNRSYSPNPSYLKVVVKLARLPVWATVLMMGTCGICCFVRKTDNQGCSTVVNTQREKTKRNKWILIFHAGLKMLHFHIKFKLKFLFRKRLLIRLDKKIKSKRDRQAVVGSKAVCLEVKHLHRPQRGTDGCVTPVHFSSNSLLQWRKTGHFYCQCTREI